MHELKTHHGWGLCVKDRSKYDILWRDEERFAPLTEQEVEWAYEDCQQQFWEDANELAREHGYKAVYSEGRSGGWLVIDPQPRMDDMWEHEQEEWIAEFAKFIEAAKSLRDDCITSAPDWIAEVRDEKIERLKQEEEARLKEAAERQYWIEREVMTV